MQEIAYRRYEYVQKQLQTDEEYLALEGQRREREAEFRALMGKLPEDQRSVVTEYIGICAELEERALELACFAP